MVKKNCKILNNNHKVEERTYARTLKKLPEMESAKQLQKIIKKDYRKKMKVLDVGCAAGHYLHNLNKIDKNIDYTGIDSTIKYIKFAKKTFKDNSNCDFFVEDIFKISKKHHKKYDITYCCNLLLHLPSIEKPISNLLKTTKKICIFRTLASKNTHLSKLHYDDKLNRKGEPVNFVYQNTFSFNFIKRVLRKNGAKKIRILQDEFKGNNVNKEFKKYQNKQSAVTQVIKNDIQIAGSKVFEWKWFKVYL